jgi:starch synthase (maltosyl-transferring)
MPAGYEYGFKKRLNVVKTRPQDWETPGYDLSTYITQVNRMKKKCAVLLEEGPMVRFNPAETEKAPVVFLAKSREDRKGRVLAVINTTKKEQQVELPDLAALLGKPSSAWEDLTPDMIPLKVTPSLDFVLGPHRMRLLYNPKGEPLVVEQLQPEE